MERERKTTTQDSVVAKEEEDKGSRLSTEEGRRNEGKQGGTTLDAGEETRNLYEIIKETGGVVGNHNEPTARCCFNLYSISMVTKLLLGNAHSTSSKPGPDVHAALIFFSLITEVSVIPSDISENASVFSDSAPGTTMNICTFCLFFFYYLSIRKRQACSFTKKCKRRTSNHKRKEIGFSLTCISPEQNSSEHPYHSISGNLNKLLRAADAKTVARRKY